jgi:DNA-binding NarL/FixJ family response regulator
MNLSHNPLTFGLLPMDERLKNSILIADDLGLVRDGLALLCESSGQFQVIEQCSDGAVALTSIETRRPDVAILDLNISRLFSLEIVRKVKAQHLPTKIIILSTRGDRKLVLEALRSGANAFLLKTGSARHLQDALNQTVAGGIYVSPELELDKIFLAQRKSEPADPLESLSSREYQVFSLLIDGIRAKEIAARLDLSPKTVDTYRASLMRKLDIHDVASLVKFAIQRDLTSIAS